jgi:hypothetical protein
MTNLYQFAPEVLAFFSETRDWAQAKFQEKGLMFLWVDGARCPTPQAFLEQLAQAVQFPGEDLSLNILGQELSNLDWLEAKRFGICVTRADLLFAQGNRYMWQYLLEMARNIQQNVEDFQRPSISWLLQMEKSKSEELQAFFKKELGFVVPCQN